MSGTTEHFGLRLKVDHGALLFLTDDAGFDLALAPEDEPAPLPDWFHFGFRLQNGAAVREMHRRMRDAGVTIKRALIDDPDYVSFSRADPDGSRIEVYWE